MLIRMPGARDYIETSRVSRIGLEDGYVKVMDGQDKMVACNFNSPEEADAWAAEVSKIVNEANAQAFALPPSGKHCLGDSPAQIFAPRQTSGSSGGGGGSGCDFVERTEPSYLLTSCTSDDFEVRIQFASGRGGDFCRLTRDGAERLQQDLDKWLGTKSFADWQPTQQQARDASSLKYAQEASLPTNLLWLKVWQQVYRSRGPAE